jgi:hypothetical protein
VLFNDSHDLPSRVLYTDGAQLGHTRLSSAGRRRDWYELYPWVIAVQPIGGRAADQVDHHRLRSRMADLIRERVEQPEKEFAPGA